MLALLEILIRQRVSHLWTVSLRIKIRPEFFYPQHLVNCGDQILRGTSLEREIDRHSEDFCHRELLKKPGGYSIYPWVGRCRAAPHTLTLFKTNFADFPTLFKTEFRFLIPCLRNLINIRACKHFAVYRPRKDSLFKTKIDKSIP